MRFSADDSVIPPFVRFYDEHPYVTPRMAYRLWAAAHYCADSWREAAGEPEAVTDLLPAIARPHATGTWLERFITSFVHIAERLERGEARADQLTRCTGDEMAFHLIVEHAAADFEGGIDPTDGEIDLLPDRGDVGDDFERVSDMLLRDVDVLMLFDLSLDGVDDPNSALARIHGTTNLQPTRWFLPYEDSD